MIIPAPRNILCSFHYYRDYNLDQCASLHIVGDSGAFSAESQGAKISTADLAGWAKQWRHRLVWVAALVEAAQAAGCTNVQIAKAAGISERGIYKLLERRRQQKG